uniref:Uncharacterized protein n=1 Tax=Arundo donax TaxID=35708 RepID=A0A0A9FUM3_ARUDO
MSHKVHCCTGLHQLLGLGISKLQLLLLPVIQHSFLSLLIEVEVLKDGCLGFMVLKMASTWRPCSSFTCKLPCQVNGNIVQKSHQQKNTNKLHHQKQKIKVAYVSTFTKI